MEIARQVNQGLGLRASIVLDGRGGCKGCGGRAPADRGAPRGYRTRAFRVLLDENGRAHLADFGLAGLHSAYEEEEASITRVGQMLGTPAYMAPEQFEESVLTDKADVYSLSVTLYEMLSGERPYPGKSMKQVLSQVVRGKTPRLRRLAKVPRALDKLVERMMHPTPASRPTAARVAEEVRALRRKHCAEKPSS